MHKIRSDMHVSTLFLSSNLGVEAPAEEKEEDKEDHDDANNNQY